MMKKKTCERGIQHTMGKGSSAPYCNSVVIELDEEYFKSIQLNCKLKSEGNLICFFGRRFLYHCTFAFYLERRREQ